MPGFDGAGTFVRTYNWTQDAANAIPILAARFDTEDNGFAAGLSNAICRDGQSIISANIPFNNKRITGLGDPTANGDALNLSTGSFIPGVGFGISPVFVGGSYGTNRTGRYIKIGSFVFYTVLVDVANKGSSTGAFCVTNLPFYSINQPGVGIYNASIGSIYNGPNQMVTGLITNVGSNNILIIQNTGSASLTDATFSGSFTIHINGQYWVGS